MLGMQADLPQEVQQVLPADPTAQLALANQIIQFAFGSKVAQIEAEAQQLREAVISKQGTIKTLERRISHLELEVQELQAKNKAAIEDSHRLQSEKGALIDTVKRLNRDIARLDAFKRSLIQHLQEDDEPSQLDRSMAAVDMSSERLVADILSSASAGKPVAATPAVGPGPGTTFSTKASGLSQLHSGTAGRGYGGSPTRGGYRSTSPTTQERHQGGGHYSGGGGGRGSRSPGSPPPPTAAAAAMDGKEFFRQARARLSYEQFSQFLNAIKDLNAGRHNREETLRFVRDLCGAAHADLYALFEGLLSRHMTGL